MRIDDGGILRSPFIHRTLENRSFPLTRPSIVQGALDTDPVARERARDAIAATYWAPIHSYLCRRWRLDAADASDATQEFFAQALERDLFHRYEPERARLRTYLRLCVDSWLRNAWKAEGRQKRGGQHDHVDVDDVGDILTTNDEAQERWFEQEWMRGLFTAALIALESECKSAGKGTHFAIFKQYDVDEIDAPHRSSYAQLASAHDIPVTQVTNYLAWSRRRFRALVLDRLRAECRSDEEFRQEARLVFGVTS